MLLIYLLKKNNTMSLDLAYSYCTGLTKDQEIKIDIQVFRNREFVINFS